MSAKRSPANDAARERAKGLVKKMETVKATAYETVPNDALQAFKELSSIALDLVNARSAEMQTSSEALATDCSKHNTYWNAFKSLFGICDEWTECMYGCD